MIEVMADIETLGTGSDAAILSIAAVKFDVKANRVFSDPGNTFYRVIDLKSALEAGGTVEADTFYWWMEQGHAARTACARGKNIHINEALSSFLDWFPSGATLWSNGSDFDKPIIESAMRRSHITPPWAYYKGRDMRTLKATILYLDLEISERDFSGTKHNALDDSINQAHYVVDAHTTLRTFAWNSRRVVS
jgi:hypothetical protein